MILKMKAKYKKKGRKKTLVYTIVRDENIYKLIAQPFIMTFISK